MTDHTVGDRDTIAEICKVADQRIVKSWRDVVIFGDMTGVDVFKCGTEGITPFDVLSFDFTSPANDSLPNDRLRKDMRTGQQRVPEGTRLADVREEITHPTPS